MKAKQKLSVYDCQNRVVLTIFGKEILKKSAKECPSGAVLSRLWLGLLLVMTSYTFGQSYYAGVWHSSDKKERILIDVSWKTFEKAWDRLGKKDFRLIDIEVTLIRGERRYFGVWHSGKDHCEITRRALRWKDFQKKDNQVKQMNLRLIDIETYGRRHERKFLGVWREGTDPQEIFQGLTKEALLKKREQYSSKYRLTDVETYIENGQRLYAGIWNTGSQDHRLWLELDTNTFLTIWKGLREQNFYLVDLECYLERGQRKYIGVWLKNGKKEVKHSLWISLRRKPFLDKWKKIGQDNMWLEDLEVFR